LYTNHRTWIAPGADNSVRACSQLDRLIDDLSLSDPPRTAPDGERHGGRITAASGPGQGATFLITLPIRSPTGPKAMTSAAKPVTVLMADGHHPLQIRRRS